MNIYEEFDWGAVFRRETALANENLIRQQLGLASREQDPPISPAMLAGWDKLCARTDQVAQLEQQLFQQVDGEQELLRRKRADELAFMMKHEAQS